MCKVFFWALSSRGALFSVAKRLRYRTIISGGEQASNLFGIGEGTVLSGSRQIASPYWTTTSCGSGVTSFRLGDGSSFCTSRFLCCQNAGSISDTTLSSTDSSCGIEDAKAAAGLADAPNDKFISSKSVDFTKIPVEKLPSVIIIGRPNVGKSALFNRLIRRREALVYNTPKDHVTRDIRDGVAKLGDLRFRVVDSAGLEAEASSGSVLGRTAAMTADVLLKAQLVLFLVDARDGLQPMDLDVGKWLRKNAPNMKTIVVMNKAELLDEFSGSLAAAAGEAYTLGFGDPLAVSAETGLGMSELYQAMRPLLLEYVIQMNVVDGEPTRSASLKANDAEGKLPLQLAIVGRPNVGKSTLLNAILQENRVLVGPESGLTRDSIRVEFEYDGRSIYLVDTAGWLERTKQDKGPSSLSIVQSRKHLMRAHVVALVLDAQEIAKAKRSMKHAEVAIARRAVEEGRGLVVVVNKMDLLRGNPKMYESVINAVPEEIQTVIPQVTGIPVVFVSAIEGRGRIAVMRQVVDTYEKWCCRLPTARLNRWLQKVMSRHSWKDQSTQPKVKYFTQVKARPPTFVAFLSGKHQLPDTEVRFLSKSLTDDFHLSGIPIRITQNANKGRAAASGRKQGAAAAVRAKRRMQTSSDKRSTAVLGSPVTLEAARFSKRSLMVEYMCEGSAIAPFP